MLVNTRYTNSTRGTSSKINNNVFTFLLRSLLFAGRRVTTSLCTTPRPFIQSQVLVSTLWYFFILLHFGARSMYGNDVSCANVWYYGISSLFMLHPFNPPPLPCCLVTIFSFSSLFFSSSLLHLLFICY